MANSKIKVIRVGAASCGMAAGAAPVLELLYNKADGIEVQEVGCLGHCYAEPMVEVITADGESILYGNVAGTEQAVDNILNLSQEGRFTIPEGRASKELVKVLKLAGRVVPTSWEDYLANHGYEAFKRALTMTPAEVVDEVIKSGLRGRGGGGFPTGRKWSFLAAKQAPEKILICNADEGDPGAFMDRSLMESVPHQLL